MRRAKQIKNTLLTIVTLISMILPANAEGQEKPSCEQLYLYVAQEGYIADQYFDFYKTCKESGKTCTKEWTHLKDQMFRLKGAARWAELNEDRCPEFGSQGH